MDELFLGGVTPLNLRERFGLDSVDVLHALPAGLTNICKILSLDMFFYSSLSFQ